MLKYSVVQIFYENEYMEVLFTFAEPEAAMDVCYQLQDRNGFGKYSVIVVNA